LLVFHRAWPDLQRMKLLLPGGAVLPGQFPPRINMREASGALARDACTRQAGQANLPCRLQARLAPQFGVRTGQMDRVSVRGATVKLRSTSARSLPHPTLSASSGAASDFHHWGRPTGHGGLRAARRASCPGLRSFDKDDKGPGGMRRGGLFLKQRPANLRLAATPLIRNLRESGQIPTSCACRRDPLAGRGSGRLPSSRTEKSPAPTLAVVQPPHFKLRMPRYI